MRPPRRMEYWSNGAMLQGKIGIVEGWNIDGPVKSL
jgi:hypothetical protein